jgi:hypothetical protein
MPRQTALFITIYVSVASFLVRSVWTSSFTSSQLSAPEMTVVVPNNFFLSLLFFVIQA